MLDVPVRPRARANAFSLYGAIGLTIAAVVHFGSYVVHTISPGSPIFWILHLGVFPLFYACALRLEPWERKRRRSSGANPSPVRWRELLPYFPVWVRAVVVLLFAYVVVNFILATSHLPAPGSTSIPSEPEDYKGRAFSGHWLLFYALPMLFFAFVPEDARPARDSDRPTR